MKVTDFIFNGKNVVNDGVIIKVKLNSKQKDNLLRKKRNGRRCFH